MAEIHTLHQVEPPSAKWHEKILEILLWVGIVLLAALTIDVLYVLIGGLPQYAWDTWWIRDTLIVLCILCFGGMVFDPKE